jgi:hypothetical protein
MNSWMLASLVVAFVGASSDEPATVEQARGVIDLSQLKLPAEMGTGQGTVSSFVANGKGKVTSVADEIIGQLKTMGCKQINDGSPPQRTDSYVNMELEKEGFRLFLSASDSGGNVFINVQNLGNIDVSKLVVPAGSKSIFKSVGSHLFTTDKKVAESANDVDQILTKTGWRRIRNLDGSEPKEEEFRQWEYLKNGVKLSVYVSMAPAMGNKTAVQYGATLMENDFLVPSDVGPFSLRDNPVLEFRCATSMPKDKAIAFYLSELPKFGWKHRSDRGYQKPEGTMVVFDRPKRALFVFVHDKDGKTQIHAEEVPPSLLEEKKDEPKPEMKKEELPIVELKLPSDARDLDVNEKQEEIKFKSKMDVKKLAKSFSTQLIADGWKEEKIGKVLTEFGGSVEFEKDKVSITVTFFKDVFAGVTEVTITGYGCKVSPEKKTP